ncbi:uncharacterized protein LOC115214870 [Argonauta hians]
MKHSPELAVLQGTFKLLQKSVNESDDLSTISKKCYQKFSPILVNTINEVCNGLMSDNVCHYTKEHWKFTLHLVVFLKVIAQKQLQEESLWKRLREENISNETDLLGIVQTVLPDISSALYFDLVTTCNWEKYYVLNLTLLDEAGIKELLNKMVQYCKEEPQSSKDITLLSSVIMMVVRACFPEYILDVPLVKRKAAISHFLQTVKLNYFINAMNADSNPLHKILCCMKTLLCLYNPPENFADSSKTDSTFFHLTCLWVAFHGKHNGINVTLIDLLNDLVVQEIKDIAYPDVAKNISEYLLKEMDLDILMKMDKSVNEGFEKLSVLSTFRSNIFIVPDSGLIIENIYLYLKWRAQQENPEPLKDFDIFSANKCGSVFHCLYSKLSSVSVKNTLDEESLKQLSHVEFISNYVGNTSSVSCDSLELITLYPSTIDQNPSDVFLEMFENRKIDDWKEKGFYQYLNTHQNLLSQKKQLLSFWEAICWLATFPKETVLSQKYLQLLLDAFTLVPSFLQDDIICETYIAVDCEDARPWWRRISQFRQSLTTQLNKLTEITKEKVPHLISQYALLDFESIMKCCITTALRNVKQMDVIVKILQLLPNSCKCKKYDRSTQNILTSHLFHIYSQPMEDSHHNTYIKLLQQLLKPFSIGACQNYGIQQNLLQNSEILRVFIIPDLHLISSLDCHHDPMLLLHVALAVLNYGTRHMDVCLDMVQLTAALLQLCHALNNCTELWQDACLMKQLISMKPVLIEVIQCIVDILVNHRSLLQETALLWLKEETNSFDWTVKLRLRKILYNTENNVDQQICCQFIKSQKLHVCEVSSILNLLRFVSVDDELCEELILQFPSQIQLTRDYTCLALAQLLPNLLNSECILVCRFITHLLCQKQLIVPCQANFLPVIPFFDTKSLHPFCGLSQTLVDCAVLLGPLEGNSSQHVLNNILAVIKKLILSENVLNQMPNMLISILVISQTFFNLVLMLKFMPWFNSETIMLYLVETTSFLSNYTSHYYENMLKLENSDIQVKTKKQQTLKVSDEEKGSKKRAIELTSVISSKMEMSFVEDLMDSLLDIVSVLEISQIKESLSRNIKSSQEKYKKAEKPNVKFECKS